MLISVATNTKHWKQFILNRDGMIKRISFLNDTRLKFYLDGTEYKKGVPMVCSFTLFKNDVDIANRFKSIFDEHGRVLEL